ncbi:MAG: hypothetical protein H7308_03980 [Chthonomonadaceae bacterium]|nr:hypothetical protein [Chthonomonadaceae bacterium]
MNDLYIGGDPGASLFSGSFNSRLDALDHLLNRVLGKMPSLRSFFDTTSFSSRTLILALFALLLVLILPGLVTRGLRRVGLTAENFRGEKIVQSYGVFPALFAILTLGFALLLMPFLSFTCENGLIVALGFGGLGLLDDVRGTKEFKGVRGHLRALFTQRKLTTGLIKAVGGLLLAAWISLRLSPASPIEFSLNLLLIALSANAFNLLDLRPGRACAVFLFCSTLLLVFLVTHPALGTVMPLILFVIPAFRAWLSDAQAKVMLGDTGSNLLGAAFGLALASSVLPLSVKALFVGFLIAFHLFAERFSLTKLIEENRFLRLLDGLTGLRD